MQLNLFDYRDPDPEPTPEPARSNLIPFRPSLSVELFGPGRVVSAARDDLQRRVNRLVDRVGGACPPTLFRRSDEATVQLLRREAVHSPSPD